MSIEIIFFIFSTAILLLASIFDIRMREVPDYLSYGFIIAIIGGSLLYSFYTNIFFFLFALLGVALFFSLGYLLYYTKQMGGADVKLLAGLGALFANNTIGNIPLPLIFLFLLLLLGSLYTLCWGFVLYMKSFQVANKKFKKFLAEKKWERIALVMIAGVFLAAMVFAKSQELQMLFGAGAILVIVSFYLVAFVRIIENLHFIKEIPVQYLTEGDWLAKDVKVGNKIICSARSLCIDKEQITILKKAKIHSVLVKIGIPFVPAILLANIATFIFFFVI